MIENHNISTEPERGAFVPLFIYGGLVATGLLLSQCAFTTGVRKQILERDGYKCVICGATDHLEAAHVSHQRDGNYNNPQNGRTLSADCHFIDHYERAGHNGLKKEHNLYALRSIWARLNDDERNNVLTRLGDKVYDVI